MKQRNYKLALMVWATVVLSGPAMAGFNITRMTTVVDDLSGSYTVTKSGRLEDAQFSGTTLTEFNGFHPGSGENEATLNGTIAKTVSRSEGLYSTLSDGSFNLTSLDNDWDVSFEALSVVITEEGVDLSGDVVVNQETYAVEELPTGLAKLLRRVFWLTRR